MTFYLFFLRNRLIFVLSRLNNAKLNEEYQEICFANLLINLNHGKTLLD